MKKSEFSFIGNWRADVFLALVAITMLMAFAEAETVGGVILTKALAIVIGLVAYALWSRWDAKGLMDELKMDNNEE